MKGETVMQEQAVQCLILQAFAAACWAGQPIHLDTSQPLTRSCRSILRHRNRCEDPTLNSEKWMRLDEMCCAPLNGSLRFSCQEGRFEPDGKPYIIQACVEEQVAPPGKTLRLSVRDDGLVHYELLVCHKDFYEDATRKSYEITAPFTGGKVLKIVAWMLFGLCMVAHADGKPLDNDRKYFCPNTSLYIGDVYENCREGFTEDSPCSCEECPSGKIRDNDNRCVLPGSEKAQTPGSTRLESTVDVSTKPSLPTPSRKTIHPLPVFHFFSITEARNRKPYACKRPYRRMEDM